MMNLKDSAGLSGEWWCLPMRLLLRCSVGLGSVSDDEALTSGFLQSECQGFISIV